MNNRIGGRVTEVKEDRISLGTNETTKMGRKEGMHMKREKVGLYIIIANAAPPPFPPPTLTILPGIPFTLPIQAVPSPYPVS